jgi:membrane associated rhomboid family serine protease
MSRDRYTWFFISTTLVVAVALLIFAPQSLTIGISGWCMALLSYLWIDLYTTRHPMAPQILAMLAINIGIGLIPGISLVGHLSGAIW